MRLRALLIAIILSLPLSAMPQSVRTLDKADILQVQHLLAKRGYTFEVLSGTVLREGQVTTLDLQVKWSDGKNTKFILELWNEEDLPIYKK